MAKKSKQNISLLGAVIVAALIGVAIAMVMFNDPGTALPPPANVEFTEEYDDSWGKLPTPVSEAKVRHILISWKGKNDRVTLKDPERTEEQARELVDQLWARYKNEPTEANWNRLAEQHSEDSGPPSQVYTCKSRNSGLDEAFNSTGLSTKPGFARIASGSFGFHLIRREN